MTVTVMSVAVIPVVVIAVTVIAVAVKKLKVIAVAFMKMTVMPVAFMVVAVTESWYYRDHFSFTPSLPCKLGENKFGVISKYHCFIKDELKNAD